MSDLSPQQYALFSLSEKKNAVELAEFLHREGLKILATGSTAAYLSEHGIPVERVSDLSGFPEILDGRVKTLHPMIHGSLLYRRDDPNHTGQARQIGLKDISVAAVNLYPFLRTAARESEEAQIIEQIDIGGPAMLRSAAKNYAHVSVLCDPADYGPFIEEWKQNRGSSLPTRRRLAAKVYSHTAHYDAMISSWFHSRDGILFPEKIVLAGERKQVLRYGENPHQHGAVYSDTGAGTGLLCDTKQLHGKEMSYNNYLDAEAALAIVRMFSEKAVAIIKHQNPCGAAVEREPAESLTSIYGRALACDPQSAFGGILAVNRTVDAELAQQIGDMFYEVILAPDFQPDALQILQSKKNLRLLRIPGFRDGLDLPRYDFRALSGGFAIQETDQSLNAEQAAAELGNIRCVSQKQPDPAEWPNIHFAWKIASRIKSNAIVLCKDRSTQGVGAGQMSRVDSVQLAIEKMKTFGFSPDGAVLASDAFFPFRDAVDRATEAGISTIIQPGGSIRDKEVIEAADQHGLVMLAVGTRHFLH